MWGAVLLLVVIVVCALARRVDMRKKEEAWAQRREQALTERLRRREEAPSELVLLAEWALANDTVLKTAQTFRHEEDRVAQAAASLMCQDLLEIASMVEDESAEQYERKLNLLMSFAALFEERQVRVPNRQQVINSLQSAMELSYPRLKVLASLSESGNPDCERIRELYVGFARLVGCREDLETGKLALEEIGDVSQSSRSQRLANEETGFTLQVDWTDHCFRTFVDRTDPDWCIEQLVAYARESHCGLRHAHQLVAEAYDLQSGEYDGNTAILYDLAYIIKSLTGGASPSRTQVGLLRQTVSKISGVSAGDLNDDDIWNFAEATDPEGGLISLELLTQANHIDRYPLRDLYMAFARMAAHKRPQHLPEVLAEITATAERSDSHHSRAQDSSNDSYREVLGIDQECSPAVLKKAYHQQVQQWHPDRLEGMAPELQRIAGEKLAEINEAYRALSGGA